MERKLSLVKPVEEKTKKFLGVPLTENVRTGIKYLGPIVAVAALELGFGFYSEYKRTQRIHETPAVQPQVVQPQSQTTDMPAPSYSWTSSVGDFLRNHSKKNENSGL